MPSLGRMSYLTTVVGSFHGRVLAARLGAEGVLVMLKGTTEGPYPLPSAVDVLVPASQLKLAREILLADAVDDAFSEMELPDLSADGGLPAGGGSETAGHRGGSLASGSDGSMTALPRAEPLNSFSSHSEVPGSHRPGRLPGLAAVLVVVLVATLVVVACLAVAAH